MEIYELLPRTNCRQCNEPTCLVFTARVAEGAKDHTDCPSLAPESMKKLQEYLAGFSFE